jgi:hypothetical protein
MSLYYRNLIQNAGLLDMYPNAAVAYSLRKLRDGYSGYAIKVRRSFDSEVQDIGFKSSGDLDTTSLNNFFGNNIILQSENFSVTPWLRGNSIVTTGTTILSPNGVDYANKLDENTVLASHIVTQACTLTINRTYFLSIYLRAGERDIVDVVSGIDNTSRVARLNLTTGTIDSTTFVNGGTLTSVGSGWYKFEVTVTSAVTSIPTGLQVRLTNGLTQTYSGTTGWGCYIWGAQVSGYIDSVVPYFKTTAVSAASAFIETWYDQSTNGNNASQTAGGNQAQLVANGQIIRDTTTGKPTTTWSSDRYALVTGINPNTRYLSIGVVNRTSNSTNNIIHIGQTGFGGVNGQQPFFWVATTGNVRSDMYSIVIHGTNTSTGPFITTSEKNVSDLKTAYLNGMALATTATEPPFAGTGMDTFGRAGGIFTTCQYAEYIYWNSEQSTYRSAIETAINNYYNIY